MTEKDLVLMGRDIRRTLGNALAAYGLVLFLVGVVTIIPGLDDGIPSLGTLMLNAWSVYWRALIPISVILFGAYLRFGYEPGQVGR